MEGDLSDLQIMRLCFKQFQASFSSVPSSQVIFFFLFFRFPSLLWNDLALPRRVELGFRGREFREGNGKEILGKTRGEEPSPPVHHLLEEKFWRIWRRNVGIFVQGVSQGILKRRIKDDPERWNIFRPVPEEIFDTVNPLN